MTGFQELGCFDLFDFRSRRFSNPVDIFFFRGSPRIGDPATFLRRQVHQKRAATERQPRWSISIVRAQLPFSPLPRRNLSSRPKSSPMPLAEAFGQIVPDRPRWRRQHPKTRSCPNVSRPIRISRHTTAACSAVAPLLPDSAPPRASRGPTIRRTVGTSASRSIWTYRLPDDWGRQPY